MKRETIADYLHRRLSDLYGIHNQIARESGVGQTTIGRIFLKQASPRLSSVRPILDWIKAYDGGRNVVLKRRRVKTTKTTVQPVPGSNCDGAAE